MTDYQEYIGALRKCAKEHENDRTSTGQIIVSNLCEVIADLLENLSSSEKPNKSIEEKCPCYYCEHFEIKGWSHCKIHEDAYGDSRCNDYHNINQEPNKSEIPTGSTTDAPDIIFGSIEPTTKNDLGIDCISRTDALRVAKNEYLRGWHDALCKALSEKYSIHCEEGKFSVIQEETITGLGLSMNCAAGKDVKSYMSTIPRATPIRPKGHWIMTSDYLTTAYGSVDYVKCSCCGEDSLEEGDYCPNCGAKMEEVEE